MEEESTESAVRQAPHGARSSPLGLGHIPRHRGCGLSPYTDIATNVNKKDSVCGTAVGPAADTAAIIIPCGIAGGSIRSRARPPPAGSPALSRQLHGPGGQRQARAAGRASRPHPRADQADPAHPAGAPHAVTRSGRRESARPACAGASACTDLEGVRRQPSSRRTAPSDEYEHGGISAPRTNRGSCTRSRRTRMRLP